MIDVGGTGTHTLISSRLLSILLYRYSLGFSRLLHMPTFTCARARARASPLDRSMGAPFCGAARRWRARRFVRASFLVPRRVCLVHLAPAPLPHTTPLTVNYDSSIPLANSVHSNVLSRFISPTYPHRSLPHPAAKPAARAKPLSPFKFTHTELTELSTPRARLAAEALVRLHGFSRCSTGANRRAAYDTSVDATSNAGVMDGGGPVQSPAPVSSEDESLLLHPLIVAARRKWAARISERKRTRFDGANANGQTRWSHHRS